MLRRLPWLLCAVLLCGCSTVSETVDKLNPFSSSAPKVKPAELVDFKPLVAVRPQWQASIGASADVILKPAIVGKRICVAAKNGSLACYENGQEVWRINVGQQIYGGVGADSKLVAVGTGKGEVLVFNAADGTPKWQARVSSEVLAAPSIGEGLVIVRSGDSRVFAFDQNDGKRRWVYQRSIPSLSLRSNVGTLLAGRGILAGFPGGKLVAISTSNGAALWEMTIAMPKGSTELERVADITSSPVIDGKQACAAAFQGRVACIDMQTGSTVWGRDISSTSGMDIDSKAVYVSDDKGAVHAYDRFSGASLWKQAALTNRGLSRPLAMGSFIIVGDALGIVHVLRREDGAFAARFTTDGSAIAAEPQAMERGFVVQTRNGGIYALALE